MEFLHTLFQKNANISAQGVRILNLKPVLETLINFTKTLEHVNEIWPRDIYQKKPWNWQTLKKHRFLKILWGEGADRIWLKLVWDTWDHPWTILDLGFLWQFCSTHDGFKRTVPGKNRKSRKNRKTKKKKTEKPEKTGKNRIKACRIENTLKLVTSP